MIPAVANRILKSLLCFAIPVYTTLFLINVPHLEATALLWVIPVWALVLVDFVSPSENRCRLGKLPSWALDSSLMLLAGLQLINIYLLLAVASEFQWTTIQTVSVSLAKLYAIKVIVGTSSAFSCIVLAHELIHRQQYYLKLAGRLLLSLVCYEHFFTEHLRGHHRRVGTTGDPATARFGESYSSFWRRTVPAQFKSAWHLESDRLRRKPVNGNSIIHHKVFQGIVLECFLLLAITYYFGFNGLLVFLIQAIAAVRKLEAINYMEHWGLARTGDKIKERDSWDSDSWFTLHSMVGLSYHADHHIHTSKPFYELQLSKQSPKLPYGYFAMIFLTVRVNRRFQAIATQELKNRRLGPYLVDDPV